MEQINLQNTPGCRQPWWPSVASMVSTKRAAFFFGSIVKVNLLKKRLQYHPEWVADVCPCLGCAGRWAKRQVAKKRRSKLGTACQRANVCYRYSTCQLGGICLIQSFPRQRQVAMGRETPRTQEPCRWEKSRCHRKVPWFRVVTWEVLANDLSLKHWSMKKLAVILLWWKNRFWLDIYLWRINHVLAMINVLSLEYLEFFLQVQCVSVGLCGKSHPCLKENWNFVTSQTSGLGHMIWCTIYHIWYMIHHTWGICVYIHMYIYIYTAYTCAHDIWHGIWYLISVVFACIPVYIIVQQLPFFFAPGHGCFISRGSLHPWESQDLDAHNWKG